MKFERIQDAIGRTPLVRLQKVTTGCKAAVYAKLEYMNPGGSIKDRIGVTMIEQAEKEGKLRPGGVIIECTSGNTGIGLAIAAKAKGYRCIFTLNDKQSKEKINMLKAFGAETIVCPTAVSPEDPRHYVQVAKRLEKEMPNACLMNQYDNRANWLAHYNTTGPEIWDDTEGRVTHFVCGLGTCGTITGVGKFLKEKNKSIKIIGVDPIGSILHDFFHTGRVVDPAPYIVEGIGEDFFPKVCDWDVIDDIVQVTDRESFLMARRLAREEGVFGGGSTGSAVAGALKIAKNLSETDLMVIIIPDSGMRYLYKTYNDEWMRDNQFLETSPASKICDIFPDKLKEKAVTVTSASPCSEALSVLRQYEFSQLPVEKDGEITGTIYEDDLISEALKGADLKSRQVSTLMKPPLPILDKNSSLNDILACVPANFPAVLVKSNGDYSIITKHDLLKIAATFPKR